MTTHRLRIDMANCLRSAADALEGVEHEFRGKPTQDDLDGAAAILRQMVEHLEQLKAGKADTDDFLDFYCIKPPAPAADGKSPNTVAKPAGPASAAQPGEHGQSKGGPGDDPTLSGSQAARSTDADIVAVREALRLTDRKTDAHTNAWAAVDHLAARLSLKATGPFADVRSETNLLFDVTENIDKYLHVSTKPMDDASFLINHIVANLIGVRPFADVQRMLQAKATGLTGFADGQTRERKP